MSKDFNLVQQTGVRILLSFDVDDTSLIGDLLIIEIPAPSLSPTIVESF